MSLPEKFSIEIKQLWQQFEPPGTFEQFTAAMEQPSSRGLRSNGLKLTSDRLLELLGDVTTGEVLWSDDGFYLKDEIWPAKTAAYHAGVFYIQEPSAMLPAAVVGALPGEKILDLCAAPGGKTVKIAADLQGEGLLWSNEISEERAKALLRNVELAGCRNCVITQETPERLAERLPLFFDRVLVDAPCSGSGMFRRDSNAASSWQKFGPEHCVPVQREILESADKMLRPGGYLIYSTCSFSVSENESMIAKFMTAHENYELLNIDSVNGLSDGLQINDELTRTVRIWPHQTNGDGHFCALLQKQDQSIKNDYHFEDHTGQQSDRIRSKTRFQEIDLQTAVQLWHNWTETSLSKTGSESINRLLPEWNFRLHKNRLHFLPASVPVFPDIKFVKTGMMLGSFRQHRSHKNGYEWKFEPSHSLFLALKALDFKFALKLPISDSRLLRYLKGESIALSESDIINMDEPLTSGAVIVICLDEFPVGQARLMPGNILKNLYPPAWRKLL